LGSTSSLFSSTTPPPPRPTLFPYTTLFRSSRLAGDLSPPCPQPHFCQAGNRGADYGGAVLAIPAGVAVCLTVDGACMPDRRHVRSEEHTSELQSRENLVCRLLLEKKKKDKK